MKRFMFSILVVTVFFLGVGALIEKTGARFKSDEKALDLVRKARVALGGDSALAAVQSLRVVGQTTRTVKVEGTDKQLTGETEIAMQMPDKLMKMIKIGQDDGIAGSKTMVDRQVVVVGKDGEGRKMIIDADGAPGEKTVKKIIVKKPDGTVEELTGPDAEKVIVRHMDGDRAAGETGKTTEDKQVFMRHGGDHTAMKQNEMLRFTLGLLLTAPQGVDVSYTFGGESTVDGTACNIVVAEASGSSFKIYLGQTSNLPVMMVYSAHRMPRMFTFNMKVPAPADGASKDVMIMRNPNPPAAEVAEFTVKFSDYRSVGGVQMPYKWVQTVGGVLDESFEVTSYEVNPANIAEKFQHDKVMVRTARPAEVQ